MADAGAERFDSDQHGVLIAIGGDLLDDQTVAGGFTLQPELVARAAEEGGEAGFDGLPKCLFVHEADHQHAAGGVVLNDGGDEAVEFCEIQIHKIPKRKSPPVSRGLVRSDEESDPS